MRNGISYETGTAVGLASASDLLPAARTYGIGNFSAQRVESARGKGERSKEANFTHGPATPPKDSRILSGSGRARRLRLQAGVRPKSFARPSSDRLH